MDSLTTTTSLTDTAEWRAFCRHAAGRHWLTWCDHPLFRHVVGPNMPWIIRRYEHLARSLRDLFGPLDGRRVLEVGGGFGGQASVCRRHWPWVEWAILDLEEAMLLQRSYCGAWLGRLTGKPDLAFSAYALSECTAEVQAGYCARLSACRSGFIVWNGWLQPDGLAADEFAALLPEGEWLPEDPRTHELNRLYVWGHS